MNKINYKKVFFSILYIGTFNNIFSTNNYLLANQIKNFTLEKENLKTEYISENFKKPISMVRFSIETTVVIIGWFLGGTVGLGTILFADFI